MKIIRTNHSRNKWNEDIEQNKSLTGIAINMSVQFKRCECRCNLSYIWSYTQYNACKRQI